MTLKILNEKKIYKTADLALAAVISLWHPVEAINKQNPRKAQFIFKRESELDNLVKNYWQGRLKVEPKAYFNALRTLKARLYGEEQIC